MSHASDCTERTLDIRAGGHRLRAMFIEPPQPAPTDSPTLVFLHEGLGSIGQWRDFPHRLVAATGCRALVYDRYGFGGSDQLQEQRTESYLEHEACRTLPEVLTACEVARPLLIGHSDGGTIALLYAASFPAHPVGVITEAAHVFVEEMTITGIREAVVAYETGDLKQKLARYHGEKTDAIFSGWSDTWLSPPFRNWNIEACLKQIVCPLLVIQGDDDQYGSVAQVDAIAGKVSGPSEALLVPDCGHVPHHQARERVLSEMTKIVNGLKIQGDRA